MRRRLGRARISERALRVVGLGGGVLFRLVELDASKVLFFYGCDWVWWRCFPRLSWILMGVLIVSSS